TVSSKHRQWWLTRLSRARGSVRQSTSLVDWASVISFAYVWNCWDLGRRGGGGGLFSSLLMMLIPYGLWAFSDGVAGLLCPLGGVRLSTTLAMSRILVPEGIRRTKRPVSETPAS